MELVRPRTKDSQLGHGCKERVEKGNMKRFYIELKVEESICLGISPK